MRLLFDKDSGAILCKGFMNEGYCFLIKRVYALDDAYAFPEIKTCLNLITASKIAAWHFFLPFRYTVSECFFKGFSTVLKQYPA